MMSHLFKPIPTRICQHTHRPTLPLACPGDGDRIWDIFSTRDQHLHTINTTM